MTPRSARIAFVLTVLAAGTLACSSPERELRKAKAEGTLAALDAFLARHPDGPLAQQAKDAKEELFFASAKAAHTQAAYDDFLKLYPDGRLAPMARAAVEGLDFKEAQSQGTLEAYERFLHRHSQGTLAGQAGQALERLLSSGPYASAQATSTDSPNCTISFGVTLIHAPGALGDAVPAVTPGVIDCSGTVGPIGIEVEGIDRPHLHHTVLQLKAYSAAGWGGCQGQCRVTFSVLGQERSVFAVFR